MFRPLILRNEDGQNKPRDSRQVGNVKKKQHGKQLCGRSRITNGSTLLPEVDGRSLWARRARDLISLHTSDCGGADNCSQAELSIIRRVATLTVELEHMEMRFATAEHGADPDELKTYQMCTNTMRRCLESLGLKRRPKDITGLSLGEVLREGLRHDREVTDITNIELEG
jgi:hypothetical protein